MRLYTAGEAADILRVSKQTVWKYGREGKLKTYHFGRTVRYVLEETNEESNDNDRMGRSNDLLHGAGCADGYRSSYELGRR